MTQSSKRDPTWKHVKQVSGVIECSYCSKVIRGGINYVKYHLASLPGKDVEICHKVSP